MVEHRQTHKSLSMCVAKTTLGPKNFYQCNGETNENGKLSNVNEAMCVMCVCMFDTPFTIIKRI